MMHFLIVLAALTVGQTKIYTSYETVRQALLKTSVAGVQSSAKQLAAAARAEKQDAIAAKAEEVSQSKNLAAARASFASLSDAVIRFRATAPAGAPVVVYCSMEKKSWLQPKGEIANPYVDAGAMRTCGSVKAE